MSLSSVKRVKYDPQRMASAIEAVRGGMPKKTAARMMGVPRSTLQDKLAGRVPEAPTKPGKPPTLTPAEETTLVEYSKLMSSIGYPLTSIELRREIKRILDVDGRPTPFKDNMPGRQWTASFLKRHGDLAFRTPMNLGHERACVTMEIINSWYDGLFKYLEKEVPDYKVLIHDPRRVFNADESGFPLQVKHGRVLAPTGAKHVYQVTTNTKTQITVMACFNAYGNYCPPMILFPGERLRNTGQEGFPGAQYSLTKSGWMDTDAFVAFLEHLVKFAKSKDIQFPILLTVDGHSTHMSLKASEFCNANKVILYCLPANATHVLQACDIGLFSPLKSSWKRAVRNWQMDNVGEVLGKKDFPALFKEAWEQVATVENACNGFRRSGLYPLSPEGIDASKLTPSKMVYKKAPQQGHTPSETATCCNEPGPEIEDIGAFVEVGSSGDNNVTVPQPPHCHDVESEVQAKTPAVLSSRKDHDYISPAFDMLNVPQPKEKKPKQVQTIREKLPKALSGSEALKMLRDREIKKQADEVAKVERKKEREEKKRIKLAAAEQKKKEKEDKKKIQVENRKKKTTKKAKRSHGSESEAEDDTVPYMDESDSSYVEEFEPCPGCGGFAGHPCTWVTCDICCTRWHAKCANRVEFELLDEDGLKSIDFTCDFCM